MIRVVLATVLLAVPRMALAQASGERMPPIYRHVPQRLTASIAGRLLDARTGQPIVKALIAARWPARQGRVPTDTLGRFLLDFVEPGLVTLDVNCPSRTMLGAHVLDTLLETDTGRTRVVELRVNVSRCVEPDSGARPASVRGVYSAGFEESRFIPCRDSTADFARLWGPPHLRQAWVEFSPRLQGLTPPRWPPAAHGENDYPRWYVEWRGVLTGPGYYGQLGVAPYLLRVDSVAVVRTTAPADCALIEQVSR